MAFPALATAGELAAWMQLTPDELPASASLVLDTVSAIVRAEARQHFTRRTTTVELQPRDGVVTLPQRPVVRVISVWSASAVLDPGGWRLFRDRLHVPAATSLVEVVYEHGYTEVPGDVRAVVLTAASRVLNNPSDLRQETAGGVSVTYAAETIGASLSPADRDLLARYRRRVAVVDTA
ncbi:hypothetical protein ACFV84_01990 [Kitasatospora sp. NPDC059811]|uniref:hypothetical protein n=1 Tax=Kitasatospora sp. NPDC059811 TaxID=3346957 RepID=UPI00364C39A0